jgi:hypothetical protein
MAMERGTPSVKTRMDFLQAVVCGRGTVSQRFRDWFPDYSKGYSLDLLVEVFRLRMKLPYWRNESVRPFIPPRDDRQLYEEMLRHKLRVIWHRAASEDNPRAAVDRLHSETREFQHLFREASGKREPIPAFTVWCQKTETALQWLWHNTHKLRLCGIADCSQFRYFIASPSRKKYCSDYCQELAEVKRSEDRSRIIAEANKAADQSKKRTLSPEGRARIVKAVKARWAKLRKGKHHSKKTLCRP